MNNKNWYSCDISNLTKEEKSFATYIVRKINRSAKELFEQAYEKQFLKECLIYDDKDNRGVMTIIESDDYFSCQVSFERDVNSFNIIKTIHDKLKNIISLKGTKDLYLNINGYNTIIINYFRNYGFVQDSLGFEYSMSKTTEKLKELSNFKLNDNLEFKKFKDNYAQDYLILLEDAFKEQDIACNEEYKLGESTILWLKKANERNGFGALWKGDCLIGFYVLENEYISNIAILSKYKGKGYGTVILNHCLKDIFINKKYEETYLYTYAINTKAQKLYLKNGFEVSAFYSENTYSCK
ncbi:GNAT family N-acetyltransferase [Sedimentibacter sp. zth1]|uniref:GNAT family N-acetyltransferase n=1 Tax=Sedimentibacter sp. zth1 TaxID=2816908 RepID=UPI001A9294E0|nr:N-acetyltransferase [Sedimentibacter sp. zth1]QSX05112.1 GNAT family N-acetyltransferase [Sedimentibacter sp. zth1]